MATEYRFLTTWLLESPREPIWEAIFDQKSWPSWWRGVEDVVELDPGDEHGVGSHSRLTWRSKLPYDLVFEARTEAVARPHLIEARAERRADRHRPLAPVRAGRGDRGPLRVERGDRRSAWMNALAPALRPAFEWNHNWVMRNGGIGIAALLGCRLLAAD